MLIIYCSPSRGPAQVLGAIACHNLQSVSKYSWLHPIEEHDYRIDVVLHDYSRWSEPATGLLARLLARRPLDAPRQPLLYNFRCQLLAWKDFDNARVIEQLDVSLVGAKLCIVHRDELSTHRKTAASRAGYANLDEVLVHAARLSVWGADTELPIPPPLTDVPIRKVRGIEVVLESDIPAHPRKHFVHRRVGCSVPFDGAFFAHDWHSFIGV